MPQPTKANRAHPHDIQSRSKIRIWTKSFAKIGMHILAYICSYFLIDTRIFIRSKIEYFLYLMLVVFIKFQLERWNLQWKLHRFAVRGAIERAQSIVRVCTSIYEYAEYVYNFGTILLGFWLWVLWDYRKAKRKYSTGLHSGAGEVWTDADW